MKRYEFICKGKKSHFLEALTEEAARSFFAENRTTSSMEIIDVIEVEIPKPIPLNVVPNNNDIVTQTISDSVPSQKELESALIGSTRVGY
jgi:hypothetical protein